VAPSPYTSFIADTLRFVGNGELVINNDTSKTAVPIPTALLVQTNGGIALSQLNPGRPARLASRCSRATPAVAAGCGGMR
jgi:hypothetical protein